MPREVLEKGPGHTSVCTLIFAGPMLVQSSGKTVPGESGVCEFSGEHLCGEVGRLLGAARDAAHPQCRAKLVEGEKAGRRERRAPGCGAS